MARNWYKIYSQNRKISEGELSPVAWLSMCTYIQVWFLGSACTVVFMQYELIMRFTGSFFSRSIRQLIRSLYGLYFTGINNSISSLPFNELSIWSFFLCRDGVSEGQFFQVLVHEVQAIRKVTPMFFYSNFSVYVILLIYTSFIRHANLWSLIISLW